LRPVPFISTRARLRSLIGSCRDYGIFPPFRKSSTIVPQPGEFMGEVFLQMLASAPLFFPLSSSRVPRLEDSHN